MKERPIIFSAPMVMAILEGRKTQTRRIAPIADLNIKPHSNDTVTWGVSFSKPAKGVLGSYGGGKVSEHQASSIIASQFAPYGQPGDRLWVRETWRLWGSEAFSNLGDPLDPDIIDGSLTGMELNYLRSRPLEYRADTLDDGPWRPSIHMPRWASRITLEITGVRVERLQGISDEDATAEGVTRDMPSWRKDPFPWSPSLGFAWLWEDINGPGSWSANPWVWVIEFKRLEQQRAAA